MTLRLAQVFSDSNTQVRAKLFGIYGLLIGINVAAWIWALVAFHEHPVLLGTALLAYGFGLRHAVDADHIAAIDNVTRKLMQEKKRPVAVGFFFSLGHSSVVVLASIGVAFAASTMQERFEGFKAIGGVIGTSVSAAFLLVIALMNLVILHAIYKAWRHVRQGGAYVEDDFDLLLADRGFMARIFRPVFPLLFSAGMSLVDTLDGHLMLGAYGWAYMKPIRKIYYNMTITLVSVVVAVVIGSIEALGLMGDQLDLKGSFWGFIGALNDSFGMLGYLIIGIFVASWAISVMLYRLKGFDRIEVNAG